ncbi:hypothetical protein ASG87_14270 [Frateuria sp. Soil773]|uniref:VOC family protein n=1 Tax=Frateuria sp. Soil773 TaxID=1736407 RepID=UPI0006F31825|nr:VOC family protein [Frateuria sp. Soil773]KRE99553.1 hypothetical protein ASG87_14270 [Frateuria sp. Soil773]
MNKTLLPWLTALLMALAVLPDAACAAPASGGYSRLGVPDLPQAVDFFHDVMNCEPVDTGEDAPSMVLMDCGHGDIVELSAAARNGGTVPDVVLATDDASAVAAWLRTNRVALLGRPRVVASGPDAGRIVVRFLAPWGQPLQLVSPGGADDPLRAAGAGLAVQ